MNDWTAGYVADIGYTYGYYHELNPLRVKLAFLNQGLVFPEVGTACELGFGQGLSANIHAAAGTAQWHGTDFNPSQAGFAKELAAASCSGARLFDDAFADFAQRADLPDFDYIGLHGIWSWISDANRQAIVDFIKRKLKVGGVLYISYNTLPGWGSFAPMRYLMSQHAEMLGTEGRGIVSRINGAIEFADKLLATQPAFLRANPLVIERMNQIKGHDRQYLAHEYFNRDWHPMHFATMGEWLEGAKLQYACSAHLLDHINALNLTSEQQAFLMAIPDAMFRETTRDFMTNQQFRRDYWVKGARKLNTIEKAEALRMQRVILTSPRADVSLKVGGALGESSMNEEVYAPFLDVLADHKVHTLGELELALKDQGVGFGQIVEAALVLIGMRHLAPAQAEEAISQVRNPVDRLNAYLCQKARGSGDIAYLASPVTGGGGMVERFEQLFLDCITQGCNEPEKWVRYTWELLSAQNLRLLKEGKTLETEDENLADLMVRAKTFAEKQLPILKALQIA